MTTTARSAQGGKTPHGGGGRPPAQAHQRYQPTDPDGHGQQVDGLQQQKPPARLQAGGMRAQHQRRDRPGGRGNRGRPRSPPTADLLPDQQGGRQHQGQRDDDAGGRGRRGGTNEPIAVGSSPPSRPPPVAVPASTASSPTNPTAAIPAAGSASRP
jgi:hypothetical protein